MLSGRHTLWILLGLPLLEIYLIARLAGSFGFAVVLLWVLIAATIGLRLMQARGWAIVHRVQQTLTAGQLPGSDLLDDAIVIIGGALLVVPGFITDGVALLCLMPRTRSRIARYVEQRMAVAAPARGSAAAPHTIDGEYRRED